MIRVSLALYLFITASIQIAISKPVNNRCSGAIALTYSGSCNFVTYNNNGAVFSMDATANCGNSPVNDIWFKVTVPSSGNLVFELKRISSIYWDMALYTGACGSLTQYRCDASSSQDFRMPFIEIHDASLAGKTLYWQMWPETKDTGDIGVCVYEPARPSNYLCDSAINLSINNSCTFKYFTTAHAGNSGVAKPNCGLYATDDVWFNATMPSTGRLIIRTENNGIGDAEMAVYKGSCGNLKIYDCATDGAPTFQQAQIYIYDTSLANQNIKIRIWKRYSLFGGSFGICAFEPKVDSNNYPQKSTWLKVGSQCAYQTFSNQDYHNSGFASPSCGSYAGADIWFRARVPASGQLAATVYNFSGGDYAMAAYTGSPDSLNEYICADNNGPYFQQPQIIINDTALANKIVYFMVWRVNTIHSGAFNLCCFEPNIPANNACEQAVEIKVKPFCNFERFSNEFTNDSKQGSPNCGTYSGADVWFKILVPPSGKFTIDTRRVSVSDFDMALYGGTCGSLVRLACDDRSSTNGSNMPRINIADSTLANQTLYLQVWRNNNGNGAEFDICVYGDLDPEVRNPESRVICEGQTVLPLKVYDGVFQYNWYDAATGGNLVASDTYQYSTTIAGTYYVEAVNPVNSKVSKRKPVSLVIYPIPKLEAAVDVTHCDNIPTIPLSVVNHGALYSWYSDSSKKFLLKRNASKYYPASSGVYYLQATDSISGCMSEVRKLTYILLTTPKIVNLQNAKICDNSLPHIFEIADEGMEYTWYDNRALSSVVARPYAKFTTSIAGRYFVVARDTSTGCISLSDSADLFIYQQPKLVKKHITDLCASSMPTVLEVINQDHSYNWYANAKGTNYLLLNSPTYTALTGGKYYVQSVASNGCKSDMDSFVFQVFPNPVISNATGYTGCDILAYSGLKVKDLGQQYNWWDANTGGNLKAYDQPVFMAQQNGVYYVEAKDISSGCLSAGRTAISLMIYPVKKPLISKLGNQLTCELSDSYQWFHDGVAITGATTRTYTADISGKYYVLTGDSNGCLMSSDEVDMKILSVVGSGAMNLSIYPNPSTGLIRLTSSQVFEGVKVVFYDVNGRLLLKADLITLNQIIDISSLPPGIYTAIIFTREKSVPVKIYRI